MGHRSRLRQLVRIHRLDAVDLELLYLGGRREIALRRLLGRGSASNKSARREGERRDPDPAGEWHSGPINSKGRAPEGVYARAAIGRWTHEKTTGPEDRESSGPVVIGDR